MKKLLILLPLLLALSPCGASTINYIFEGQYHGPVSSLGWPLLPGLEDGMTFTGTFSYDPDTYELQEHPAFVPATVEGRLSLSIAGYEYVSNRDFDLFGVFLYNSTDSSGIDSILFWDPFPGPWFNIPPDRPEVTYVYADDLYLFFSGHNIEGKDFEHISLNSFREKSVAFVGGAGGGPLLEDSNYISDLYGTLTRFHRVGPRNNVPDAGSTLLMLGFALSGLVFVKMKRVLLAIIPLLLALSPVNADLITLLP